MEKDLNNIEKIEAYLNNELSAEEKLSFEKEMATNPDLKKQFELQKDIHRAVKMKAHKELKAELDEYYQDYKESKSRKSIMRTLIPVISVAATITLVLFLVFSNGSEQPANDYITLDSVQVLEEPNYADSANYVPDSNKMDTVELKSISEE